MASKKVSHYAELQYSPEYNRMELVVPQGTKIADLAKVIDAIGKGKFGNLPRGCLACTSGDNLIIRERLENVIRVNLERGSVGR
jgi:hypothetical protein